MQLLIDFHNSSPDNDQSSVTPPPSPHSPGIGRSQRCPENWTRVESAPVRVSVIMHTSQQNVKYFHRSNKKNVGSEKDGSKNVPTFPVRHATKPPPTKSSYTQEEEIFAQCKNTNRFISQKTVHNSSRRNCTIATQEIEQPSFTSYNFFSSRRTNL